MQEKLLYEYAIIRIVPRVEREEFINTGVVLYCRQKRWVKMLFAVNAEKIKALYGEADITELEKYLVAFQNICSGRKEAGPIALLDVASRFRWLTATRSTIIQTSKVHPGFCSDPELCLQQLFEEQVL